MLHRLTQAKAWKVRLLEFRAEDLSIQSRNSSDVETSAKTLGAEVLDLRALLAKGGRKADLKVIRSE